jgi:hypothetical protein
VSFSPAGRPAFRPLLRLPRFGQFLEDHHAAILQGRFAKALDHQLDPLVLVVGLDPHVLFADFALFFLIQPAQRR